MTNKCKLVLGRIQRAYLRQYCFYDPIPKDWNTFIWNWRVLSKNTLKRQELADSELSVDLIRGHCYLNPNPPQPFF